MLHDFVRANRAEIIARCRAKISTRPVPRPTDVELEHGVPLFLDQLADSLRLALGTNPAIAVTAAENAAGLLHEGFTIAQVVHNYGGICQTITEMAGESALSITIGEFRTLNLCLDDAIAGAVTEYSRVREYEGTERLGHLAHELRNLLNSAVLSYEMLKSGNVGFGGSTSGVLGRSLAGLQSLVDRELAEVRLRAGIHHKETVAVREFLEDVEAAATLEANARGLQFSVVSVGDDVTVHVDRQILASVVANLLQNAFKFTRASGRVALRARATPDRVLIDIEDQCGGLPPGRVAELFGPFRQHGADRTGLGLGLSVCDRGVRVNGGDIHVHNPPERVASSRSSFLDCLQCCPDGAQEYAGRNGTSARAHVHGRRTIGNPTSGNPAKPRPSERRGRATSFYVPLVARTTVASPRAVQSFPASYYVHQLRQDLVGKLSRPAASRLLWLPVHVSIVIAGTVALAGGWLSWPLALATSLLIGLAFGGLMFLGHETMHGAVLRGRWRRAKSLVGFLCFAPLVLSPRLWSVWHNRTHHSSSNRLDVDPDMYPSLDRYRASRAVRFATDNFALGGRRWRGLLSLVIGFSGQSIHMLLAARTQLGMSKRDHRVAIAEFTLAVALWISVAIAAGAGTLLLSFVVPVMVANVVVMAFILTNHALSPATEVNDPLLGALSVTTPRWVEWLTLDFGYHVEHHLFPATSGRQLRHVRAALVEAWPQRYQTMPLRLALARLFNGGRVYKDSRTLVDPRSGGAWPTLAPRGTP